MGLNPPEETGEGRTLRQEIKRIDTALRTNDQTALADDDLLDVAGHRCYRSRGNRIKERENREFWIRQTTVLLAIYQ